MGAPRAKFAVGDVIHHRLFDYRGVIVDVDATYAGGDRWYEEVARSRPPKNAPWYHVLVSEATHTTYVAERNLEPDRGGGPAHHPLLAEHFEDFREGRYVPKRSPN
jgi:heat shock protein HspQ